MTANTRLDVLRKLLDMSMQQAAIGAAIKRAREEKKMTQRQVAAQIPGRDGMPVDDQTVSRWERGRHAPDLETLQLIAEVLDKPLSYFVGDEPTLRPLHDGHPGTSREEQPEAVAEALAHLARAVEALAIEQRRQADEIVELRRELAPSRRTVGENDTR